MRIQGVASWRATYAVQGNQTSEAYFDTEGKPCMKSSGYSCVTIIYDAQENMISLDYYDAEEKLLKTISP